jgi:hypothetical protein
MLRQTVIGAAPVTPNGILLPKGSDFDLPFMQKLLENAQVQADGVQRQSGKGNPNTDGAGGKVVANLSFMPYLLKWWCGTLVTTGSATPYSHVAKVTRAVLLYMFELGLIPYNLFYQYFGYVCTEIHLSLQTEGICELGTKFNGSGKVNFPGSAVTLDTTPTELIGPTLDMSSLVLLENGTDAGDIHSLNIDCVTTNVQKRPTGAGGLVTQHAVGKKKVSGKVKFWFESDARWSRVRSGTLTPIRATLADTDGNTGILDLTECELESIGPKITDNDGVTQEYTFNSIRKTNLVDTPLKGTFSNPVAAYD